MEEKNYNNTAKSHKVLLVNRGNGAFSGVVDVLSFDVVEILLETELGMLLIKGQDLHVNRLSLEKGEVDIEGRIDSLTYSDVKTAGKQAALRGLSARRSSWASLQKNRRKFRRGFPRSEVIYRCFRILRSPQKISLWSLITLYFTERAIGCRRLREIL